MTKRAESKYKINRRLGVNLWGRSKSPIAKREYGPGQHGQRRKKATDYGTQLMAKQKLKGYYGNISEKQFRKYYEEAIRRRGDTSEKLIELLERRLDAVCYRMKFAITPFAARQFVSHGHLLVNGHRVNIPSYLVKDGDTIEVKEKSKQLAVVLDATQSTERDVPEYLEVDHRAMKGRFSRAPKLSDVPYPVQMEPNLVVEYLLALSSRGRRRGRGRGKGTPPPPEGGGVPFVQTARYYTPDPRSFLSDRQIPPIHVEFRAGDVGRFIRREEQHGIGDLVHFAGAAQRHALQHLRPHRRIRGGA